MVLVTFRESSEQLVAMFNKQFASIDEAKKFIKKDANHWIKAHELDTVGGKLFNIDPEGTDHFEVHNNYGCAVITYRYFTM